MLKRAFFDQRAPTWDETVAEKDISRLRRMAERLDIRPGATVLDVGTGTGIFLPFILSQAGAKGQVIALDFAGAMLRLARSKGYNRNVDYLCADVSGIPLAAQAFDNVVCYSSFPHFPDKIKALAEMGRVLKSGGRLSVCHTSGRAWINRIHRQIPAVRNDIIPDADEMRGLLSAAGFTDIAIADEAESYLVSARKR